MSKQMKKIEPTTAKTKVWKSPWGRIVFTLSILLAVFTILQVTNYFHLEASATIAPFDLVAYFAWTMLPPAWFLYEYVWLFSDADKLDPNKVSDLKYVHELAGKVWASLVVLLSVILYLKYHIVYGKVV
jgi:hypothetical protein